MFSLVISKMQTPKVPITATALDSLFGMCFIPEKGYPEIY